MFENMRLIKVALLVSLGITISWSLYSILYLGDDLKIVLGAAIVIYILTFIISILTILSIRPFL